MSATAREKSVKYRANLPSDWQTRPVHVWLAEKLEVIVFNTSDGLQVFNSICPHMGAQLQFQNGVLFCPWHGLSYDIKTERSDHHRYKRACSHQGEVVGNELLIYE